MRLIIFMFVSMLFAGCDDKIEQPEPYKSEYNVHFFTDKPISSAYIVAVKDTVDVHIKDTVAIFQPSASMQFDTTITMKANFMGYFVIRGEAVRHIEYDKIKFSQASPSDSMFFELPK